MDTRAEIKKRAMLSGHFTLRSGQTTETYFDKYQIESDPVLLTAIADDMVWLLPSGVDVLAGLELGGIPLVTALSRSTGLPAAFIRKEAKTYGTCKCAEGADMSGKSVVLVEDVVSSGGAILDALTELRKGGIEPQCVVCMIDRQSGAVTNLKKAGIELRALYTMEDIVSAK